MQTEGTKLIFIMNFSVLGFFKFAPKNASNCTDFSLDFFRGRLGGTPPNVAGWEGMPPDPGRNLLFFSLVIPGSGKNKEGMQ